MVAIEGLNKANNFRVKQIKKFDRKTIETKKNRNKETNGIKYKLSTTTKKKRVKSNIKNLSFHHNNNKKKLDKNRIFLNFFFLTAIL